MTASISPTLLVKKFRRGIKLMEEREKQEIAAKNVIVRGQGVQIPMQAQYPYPPPAQEVKPAIQGIAIASDVDVKPKRRPPDPQKEELRALNIRYPVNPESPQKGEKISAYTNIKWVNGELQYLVWEPPLTPLDKDLIVKIKSDLEERLDIDFNKIGEVKAKQVLKEEIQKSFARIPGIPLEKQETLSYYMERDFLGLGKIDTLMRDGNIEDISCDGIGLPIFIFHRDPKLGSMRSNIAFETEDELNSFVAILAQKCKKNISIAEPLLDGSLPDGSRVQATLGTDIARKGSNFTIRKFTDKPLTPTHMMRFRTMDSTELAYMWIAIENGQTVLVSGGTATGKTSMLNALSLFIRPGLKVVSIEDTPELRLPLPHWIPHVARSPLSIKGKIGEVTLFDLLKSSLRQRPDYIIVGEVRGEEAFVLFQQISTGHPSLATIHAATVPQLVDRLITPPISLPPTLIENIDIIVFLTLSRLRSTYVRRTNSIMEVTGVKDDRPETVRVFGWKPATDSFEPDEKSVVLRKISERLGITEDSIKEEISRRKLILEWMLKKEIYDYREVARVISTYYSDPERVMSAVRGI